VAKPLLILAPMRGEIRPAVRSWPNGVTVSTPKPAKVWSYEREGRTVLAGWAGIGREATESAIRALAGRPSFVLQVGVAGGLRDGQESGDAFFCERAFEGDRAIEWKTPQGLRDVLGLSVCGCVTVPKVVIEPEGKRALGARYVQADLVEMETYWGASQAQALSLPFAAVRVVCDVVDQRMADLSPALDPVGDPKPLAFASHMARNPRDATRLKGMAVAFKAAQERLRQIVESAARWSPATHSSP